MSNLLFVEKFSKNSHFIMSFLEFYILGDIQEPMDFRDEFIEQIFIVMYHVPGIVLVSRYVTVNNTAQNKKKRKRYKTREVDERGESERGRDGR